MTKTQGWAILAVLCVIAGHTTQGFTVYVWLSVALCFAIYAVRAERRGE